MYVYMQSYISFIHTHAHIYIYTQDTLLINTFTTIHELVIIS